jgi:soluble lytic murein transglycosylase
MEFLLGFFRFSLGGSAYPYIREYRESLSVTELRTLAAALAEAGRWDESLRISAVYRGLEPPTRADMELYYPRPYQDLVETYAAEAGISPALLYGLIHTESAFTADIRSRAGALGLTQLLPSTAEEMAGRLRRRGGPDYAAQGELDLTDPETNIHLGSVYLEYLIDRLENPMLALLSYNGGMGRVRRWRAAERSLPPDLFLETIEVNETREYGRKVLSAAAAYGYLYYNMTIEGISADIYR